MIVTNECRFVPEAVIVFILKHARAFEWVCINCQCRAELQGNTCSTQGGKWQQAQGETGLDIVARLSRPQHRWFVDVDANCTTLILEAKGDRTVAGGLKLNRPAYNEMTGALSAFFLSNLGRIRDNPDRLYGWLVPTTFYQRKIEDFREAVSNLPIALPPGREFLIGIFDTAGFWRDAPPDLQSLAWQWFQTKEGGTTGRNTLVSNRLGRGMPELASLAEKLFRFEIVKAAKGEI
jgi:hypothetical protein